LLRKVALGDCHRPYGTRACTSTPALDMPVLGRRPGSTLNRSHFNSKRDPPGMPCLPGSCSTALASTSLTGLLSSGDTLPMATLLERVRDGVEDAVGGTGQVPLLQPKTRPD
jgi:hypothetical protein